MKTLFTSFTSLALVVLFFSACQKKTDCKANITCQDANGKPVSNASVHLYATVKTSVHTNVTADVQANGVTDQDGKVSFVFKLPAIFDIHVAVGTTTATSIIKLEEGKNTEKIVELN